MLAQCISNKGKQMAGDVIMIGSLKYDADQKSLSSDKATIYLRNKLNDVLNHLLIHKQRTVLREELIEKVWHGNFYTGDRGLTHSMCKLRRP
jgi:DNA-binding winged helix-turn-helix (wHTH) protein